MLIEFSVGNYLSFKDVVTFSMVAAGISQHADTHVFEHHKYKLLKSAVLYGANASGKSNLFKAMRFAKDFINNSSKESQAGEPINVEPFLLSAETENEPSFFEFVFLKDNVKYRYGFKANRKEVVEEWLFKAEKIKEIKIFERNYQDIPIGEDFDFMVVVLTSPNNNPPCPFVRENALFLSTAAQFNEPTATSLIKWFFDFKVLSAMEEYTPLTIRMFKEESFKRQFLETLKIADLSIEDYSAEIVNNKPEIKTLHKKYNKNNKYFELVEFDLKGQESQGTQNLFSILGPVLNILNTGRILVIDEFDVNLHPLITTFLIKLFNSKKHNPNNAQLIFNTHDTNLLNKDMFRRDQIWFAEKDEYGATDLYSLVEYKEKDNEKVRADRSFAKDYLAGRYGAIPFVGSFDFFCEDEGE